MANEIENLIDHLKEVGGLTLTDIASLLEKPRCTVYTWYRKGRTPKDYAYDFVVKRLEKLKSHAAGKMLIKPTTNERTRQAHVSRLKDELFGLPAEDTSR